MLLFVMISPTGESVEISIRQYVEAEVRDLTTFISSNQWIGRDERGKSPDSIQLNISNNFLNKVI